MSQRMLLTLPLVLATIVPLGGCGHTLPPIVPVEGVVFLDGQPLPHARVTFIPMLDHFGAESNSIGQTDEKGAFTLTCQYNDTPGAVVGDHVVLVTESDLPEDLVGEQDGRIVDAYRAKLGNRPIPPSYSAVSRSPLRFKIVEGQRPVQLELSRNTAN